MINFSLLGGTYSGIKLADLLFWNDDLKYQVWEATEIEYWQKNGLPKYVTPKVKFESIIKPKTIFTSYIKESGPDDLEQVMDKYI